MNIWNTGGPKVKRENFGDKRGKWGPVGFS
jgi:hypothetical protein